MVRLPSGGADPPADTGYRIERLSGGLDVTGPDGGRLLLAAGPGAAPDPITGARPYQAVLLDLAGDPAQLGLLRRRGLVTQETMVAPVHIDHRLRSEEELARRCALWRAVVLDDGSLITAAPGGGAGAPDGASQPWRVLLIGGARSGKSAEAELRLAAEPEVTYVAAGPAAGTDPEWASRVAAHQARRPRWWRTAETLDLPGELRAASGALLVDGIGTWLAETMSECGIWEAADHGRPPGRAPDGAPDPGATPSDHLAARIGDLLDAWRHTGAHVVAVTDETGSGVVPASASGRMFRDELGRLNQLLAADSDETALVVAGRVLPLPA